MGKGDDSGKGIGKSSLRERNNVQQYICMQTKRNEIRRGKKKDVKSTSDSVTNDQSRKSPMSMPCSPAPSIETANPKSLNSIR